MLIYLQVPTVGSICRCRLQPARNIAQSAETDATGRLCAVVDVVLKNKKPPNGTAFLKVGRCLPGLPRKCGLGFDLVLTLASFFQHFGIDPLLFSRRRRPDEFRERAGLGGLGVKEAREHGGNLG